MISDVYIVRDRNQNNKIIAVYAPEESARKYVQALNDKSEEKSYYYEYYTLRYF